MPCRCENGRLAYGFRGFAANSAMSSSPPPVSAAGSPGLIRHVRNRGTGDELRGRPAPKPRARHERIVTPGANLLLAAAPRLWTGATSRRQAPRPGLPNDGALAPCPRLVSESCGRRTKMPSGKADKTRLPTRLDSCAAETQSVIAFASPSLFRNLRGHICPAQKVAMLEMLAETARNRGHTRHCAAHVSNDVRWQFGSHSRLPVA